MKYTLACLLLAVAATVQGADLAQFNQNNYDGWTYWRGSVWNLTTAYISANKVTLFKTSKGTDYTLTSPMIDASGHAAVKVDFTYISRAIIGGDFSNYSMHKMSPYVELLDSAGDVLAKQKCTIADSLITHTLSATLQLPSGMRSVAVRLAAYDADANNAGAVREVTIAGTDGHKLGDVDGNGNIDVSDATIVINYVLGRHDGLVLSTVDINGDGQVDVSDVTTLVNLILSAEN